MNEPNVVDWLTLGVLIITVGVALSIGTTQNNINEKLKDLQDTVEVFSYPVSGALNTNQPKEGFPWLLRAINVGTVQLYVTSYSVNGVTKQLNNALLPAGQQQSAWYQIPLIIPTSTSNSVHIVINLMDKFNRNWQSTTDIEYINGEWESTTYEIRSIK